MKQNRITYMILLGLCVAFVLLYGRPITYMALYAVLILPVLSLLYTVLAVRGLRVIDAVDSDHIIKSDEIVYKVTILNKGWLPVFCARVSLLKEGELSPFETAENLMVVAVKQRFCAEVNFPIVCRYRGIFPLQAARVEALDVLGLFSFKLKMADPLELTVYPALADIKSFPLSAVNASDAPSVREAQDEDYSVVTDLRKYQPEDSFKKVHWKISAKKNEIMVKSFQAVNLNAVVLLLNNRSVPFDRHHTEMERISIEDKLVESVISVAGYGLMRRFPVELYYMDEGLERVAEDSHLGFNNMYNACAGIEFNGPPRILGHLNDILFNREEFINLVVFTSEMNSALCEEIRAAKIMGHNPVVIYAETRAEGSHSSLNEGIRQLLMDSGVVVYYVPFESSVGEVVSL